MKALEVSLHEQAREELVERVVVFTGVRTIAVPMREPTRMTAVEVSLQDRAEKNRLNG